MSRKGHDIRNLAGLAAILVSRAVQSAILIFTDVQLVARATQRTAPNASRFEWRYAVLPLLAASAFVLLLRAANPVLDTFLQQWSLCDSFGFLDSYAPLAFIIALAAVWSLFRLKPRATIEPAQIARPAPAWHRAYFAPIPVIATLLILNALFLAQNQLDIRYIWSGADLPPGMTHAAYVHDGANMLIATVLLAALLMILALWPGSRTEQSRGVRMLVYLWIAQNVVLVISCVSRTLSYVDAYGLTLLRLAGLVWMGLIVIGLVLIAIRVLARRNNLWLLNANLAAAFLVLWASGFVDYRAIVADYNVNHAIVRAESNLFIAFVDLDLKYIEALGPSAAPALERLSAFIAAKAGPGPSTASDAVRRLSGIRYRLKWRNNAAQNDWRTWTLRGALLAPHLDL